MPSSTQIANLALGEIGQTRINDINDTTSDAAKDAKLFLIPVIKSILRAHPWNCAKDRAELAQNVPAPAFGWTYSYTLPTKSVKLITLNGYNIWDWRKSDWFEIEKRNILTDAEEAKITFIEWNGDPTSLDDMLVECVWMKLAAKLASKVSSDDGLAMKLEERYERILEKAKLQDNKEKNRRPLYNERDSQWVASRYYQPGT